MYETVSGHDALSPSTHKQIFSLDTIRENRVETFTPHKTSRRALLVCSLLLIATAGLLATWVFVSKPSFYPRLSIFSRTLNNVPNDVPVTFIERSPNVHDPQRLIRHRRNIDIYRNATRELVIWKVDFTQNTDSELTIEFVNDPSLFPTNDSRLPTDLLPTNYRLALDIDVDKDSFNGSVKITLKCVANTSRLIFHGRKLVLTKLKIKDGSEIVEYRKITYIKKFEMYVIELDKPNFIENGTYELYVDYYVAYGKNLAGLYKSNYTTKDKKQRTIVSSHFEPIDARSAFPCLDEPAFKATFDISITHHKDYLALSNMPVKDSSERDNNTIQDTFHTSVVMSTYLVAFSVNDFKYKEDFTASGIRVRVYAREDDFNRIDYPLMAATKIIAFYEDYFQISYPLPKLDLLAVPEFMAGAMEDWGLVSFRGAYLVFDEEVMTPESLRQVTLVIAHELAHQWFGNLVTMKWWNDIWLNEGFANFVEMIGTNEVNEQFHALKIQVPTGWQSAIALDSLKNTHPVSPTVSHNSEIDELFDTISYNKGASLLRMVEGFMGDDLIAGVRAYLREYKYSNAATDDLWKHLSNVSRDNLEIKEIMDTWTKQSSFPVISLSRNTNGTFTMIQESYLQVKTRVEEGGSASNHSSTGDMWQVPFTFVTSDNPKMQTVWMKDREMTLNVSSEVKWIKANIDSMGFYLVNYDNETWINLQKQLAEDHEVFTPVNRAGILHDAFKLSCEMILDPTIPLALLRYSMKENSLIPWSMIRSKHECLTFMMSDREAKMKYKKYVWKMQAHLVNESMLSINSTTNKSLTLFERVQRMETFSYGLKNNITRQYRILLEEIFNQMVEQGDRLPGLLPEIRSLAIIYGHDSSNDKHWDFLWKLYGNSPVDTDRKIVMKAFALFKDKDRVSQMLEKSLDTATIRIQDTIPFLSIIVKISSRKQVWDFVTKNYQRFKDRYSGGYHLGQLLGEIASGFTKEEELKEVKAFILTHPIGAKGSRTEKQIIEKIENSIRRHSNSDNTQKQLAINLKSWLDHDEKHS